MTDTNHVNLTRAQYLRIRRKCRIDGRGPKPGWQIRYDIPGHDNAFIIANWSQQPGIGKEKPYCISYDFNDHVTRRLVKYVVHGAG